MAEERENGKNHPDLLWFECTFMTLSSIFILTTDMLKLLKTNGSKSQQRRTCMLMVSESHQLLMRGLVSASVINPGLHFRESCTRSSFLLVFTLLWQRTYSHFHMILYGIKTRLLAGVVLWHTHTLPVKDTGGLNPSWHTGDHSQ